MIHINPFSPTGVGVPSSSITSATIPGKANVAQAGLIGVAPGSGLIICPPVSVCQYVSTIAHLELPTTS